MKTCPVCGEANFDTAVKCRHCDGSLRGAARTAPVETSASITAEGTSGKAIASFLCGIFFFILPAAILAIILGHVSRSEIRQSGGRLRGAGMASTGLVLGYVGAGFVPILLIVAAIAIPNLLRARMAANEASAVGSLRIINTACYSYASEFGMGFPKKLGNLGPNEHPTADAANLIDAPLASGRKTGYLFFYRTGGFIDIAAPGAYVVNADPLTPNTTGMRHFFTDQTRVIRYDVAWPASEKSRPLE